ncbi:MAG: hypothetical protein NTV98_06105 [Candidatus Roizmanbacteria bacterium]|nr:hypothetical protein [Candidatus Roizmanbacteria bacterium]
MKVGDRVKLKVAVYLGAKNFTEGDKGKISHQVRKWEYNDHDWYVMMDNKILLPFYEHELEIIT